MANMPRPAWSELGKPLRWLYDAFQLKDPDLPNVLRADEVGTVVDATQNGWAEQRHLNLEIQGNVGHASPGILFGPTGTVNTWAGLTLEQSSDLLTDTNGILIHLWSVLKGTAGALGFEFRIGTPYVTNTDLAAALFLTGFTVPAGQQTSWYAITSGGDRSVYVPPLGKFIVSGMNGANVELQVMYTKIRAGHRPVR